MDKNLVLGILTFVVAVLQLFSQQTFVPPAWIPYILLVIGVLNVIISTFFANLMAKLTGK